MRLASSAGRAAGIKLIYERVAARRIRLQRQPSQELMLADTLEAKDGPFTDYLLDELTRRADYRCVDTLAQFRAERRAVTVEGQVRSGDRHEKDDRSRVDDPRTWVLGWANERKIAALRAELADLIGARQAVEARLGDLERDRERLRRRQEALSVLASFASWSDLDVAEAVARADTHDEARARLEAGSSRLKEITEALRRNDTARTEAKEVIDDLTGRLATLAAAVRQAKQDKARDDQVVAQKAADEMDGARSA